MLSRAIGPGAMQVIGNAPRVPRPACRPDGKALVLPDFAQRWRSHRQSTLHVLRIDRKFHEQCVTIVDPVLQDDTRRVDREKEFSAEFDGQREERSDGVSGDRAVISPTRGGSLTLERIHRLSPTTLHGKSAAHQADPRGRSASQWQTDLNERVSRNRPASPTRCVCSSRQLP